jgi:4-amino-4-deoxy-L-arabinose transferase-like glycosyltransferase
MERSERNKLIILWLALGVLPLLLRPLWEPDEGRYAEIPRAMLAFHDWLTPRLNQVLYFEKPPFQYWLSALAMKGFGLNAFAARLPLALASLVAMFAAWRLARRLGADQPVWAAFMAGTTLLGYICGQILTLDALFSALFLLSLLAVLEAVAARFEGRSSMVWTLIAFGANALALLTKGLPAPVLLGVIALASLPWTWRHAPLRSALLKTIFHPLGWLLFAAIAAPWFIWVDRVNPGHAQFFFIHEHFARFSTTVHARQGSDNAVLDKLYFLGVLLVGLLPWLSASILGLRRGVAFLNLRGPAGDRAPLHRWMVVLLLLAFAVPLAFFSVSHSKLPPYILPVVVPLVALACAFERKDEAWRTLAWSGRELLVLGAIFALAGPFLVKEPGALPWLLGLGLALLILGFWAQRPRHLTGPRWMAGLIGGLLLLTVAAQAVVGPSKAVENLVRVAPRNAQWISCGNYYQGIAFHAGQRVVVIAGTGELAFGRDHLAPLERDRWFQEDPLMLTPMALRMRSEHSDRPVWALVDEGTWKHLPVEQRGAWDVAVRRPKLILARLR